MEKDGILEKIDQLSRKENLTRGDVVELSNIIDRAETNEKSGANNNENGGFDLDNLFVTFRRTHDIAALQRLCVALTDFSRSVFSCLENEKEAIFFKKTVDKIKERCYTNSRV